MNIKISILLLIIAQMACQTTTEPFATYPAETPTALTAVPAASLSQEPESGAVFETTIQPRCATVTAAEALHLRAGPSEKTEVLEYLYNGEQVTIIQSRGVWWKVETATSAGYSKADFLKESDCE